MICQQNILVLPWKYIYTLIVSHTLHATPLVQASIISHLDYAIIGSDFLFQPLIPNILFSTLFQSYSNPVYIKTLLCWEVACNPPVIPSSLANVLTTDSMISLPVFAHIVVCSPFVLSAPACFLGFLWNCQAWSHLWAFAFTFLSTSDMPDIHAFAWQICLFSSIYKSV